MTKGLSSLKPILLVLVASLSAAGQSRLVDAVRERDKAAVAALVEQGIDVDSAGGDGATALHWASYLGDLELVERLIAAGANVNAANDLKVTPLALACAQGDALVVQRLLTAGALADAAGESGVTPLMEAARAGSVEAVRALLAFEANPNARESDREQTALMWAVSQKHPGVVQVLIQNGGSVHARSRPRPHLQLVNRNQRETAEIGMGGFTPLMFAAQVGDIPSARLLLGAGANVDDTASDRNSALILAIHAGNSKFAAMLLDEGANPNTAGAGYTALHLAALRGDVLLVRKLLVKGADPNSPLTGGTPIRRFNPQWALSQGLAGATPFYIAASLLELDVMRDLAAAGAQPNPSIPDGTTPLLAALGLEVERPLRPSDSDFNPRPPRLEAPTLEALKILLDMGADVNRTNRAGETALHVAAAKGFLDVIQLLADRGANLSVKNQKGQTPLSLTISSPAAQPEYPATGDNIVAPPALQKAADLLRKLGARP